jgi:hypothetical protein
MSTLELRAALSQHLKRNPGKALNALNSAGLQLNELEKQSLLSGNLDNLTDQQLLDRFNAKTLGLLGLDQGLLEKRK